MLQMNDSYEVDRSFFNCDCILYIPTSLNDVGLPDTQLFFDIPKEDSVILLKNVFF